MGSSGETPWPPYPPFTGIADQTTCQALVAAYEPALIEVAEAQPIEVILNPGQVIRKGESHPNVYLAQAMLTVLSQTLFSITPPSMSGVNDVPTSNSLASFQELSLLPVTGELDKQTWKHLALHYPSAATTATR